MTEHIREKISALMDGELDPTSFTMPICDDEAKATWFRYHLISDIMHQRIPVNPRPNFSQRISDSIKQEPAILAPAANSLPAFVRPVAGLAIAASVAALAILGIQQYRAPELAPVPQTAQVSRSEPALQTTYNTGNLDLGVPVRLPVSEAIRPVQLQMHADPRINRYILNHNEYQSSIGVQGMPPHIRLVVTGTNE